MAALFAWLAFAPLQSDQLEAYLGGWQEKDARSNFSTISDSFFVSFVMFSIAAGSDYLFHNPAFAYYHNADLPLLIGGGFFAGVVTLVAAMFYLRSIVRGDKTWPTLGAPSWVRVVGASGWTGFVSYGSFSESELFGGLLGFVWLWLGLLAMLGGYWLLRYWKVEQKTQWGEVLVLLPALAYMELLVLSRFF